MNTRKFTVCLIQQLGIHADKQKKSKNKKNQNKNQEPTTEEARNVSVLLEIKLVS
jgi:hypothetical protein